LLALSILAGALAAQPRPCPAELPAATRCYASRDEHGAYQWTAIPADWNGILVVHSHGGPRLGAPKPDDEVDDLRRFAVMVAEGYAWTGSTYRRGGFGVQMAAEDTDRARAQFWQDFGRPPKTFLHGQSWGAAVASKAAALAAPGTYDGVLLTSGIVVGAAEAYDFRAHLRTVYQFYCANLPRPDETPYPPWQGLGAHVDAEAVSARLNECTGVQLDPGRRSPQQRRALANILGVTGLSEQSLPGHLHWSTQSLRALTMDFLKGANPFGNAGVRYRGSDDDDALNAGVARFVADPGAVAALEADSGVSGALTLPTLSMHAIDDPIVFVEGDTSLRERVAAQGKSDLLVQTYTQEAAHTRLAVPQYAALLQALRTWVEQGQRPTPAGIAAACPAFVGRYGEACKFVPGYVPRLLSARGAGGAAPPVRTAQGLVQGEVRDGVERFIGLPYATAVRWEAPEPAPAWPGVRAPLAQSPRCPQSAAGLADGREREDCLFLDVYRPAGAAKPRAVYVYVHGGGATNGGASDHDGAALAAQGDIVVVTVNYRLGALGFLNSALLNGEGGNFALRDVAAALRWVNASIAAFGGDPSQVTLGGESAGGTVICPLLTDPGVEKLVRAAIVSSDDCLRDTDIVAAARARAAAYVQRLGCLDAACLRALPAAALVGGLFAAPTVDERRPIRVPLLLGANRDEGRAAAPEFFGMGREGYLAWLARLVGADQAARVEQAYRGEGAGSGARFEVAYKAAAIITDSGMRGFGGCALPRLARLSTGPVYLYRFDDPAPPYGEGGGFAFGAAHGAELPYLWPAAAFAGAAARFTPAQRSLSGRMIADWGRFVRTGRPGWPALRDGGGFMAYDPAQVGERPLADYRQQHRCDLWDSLPAVMSRGDGSR